MFKLALRSPWGAFSYSAGHETCVAGPLLDHVALPVMLGNPKVKKQPSGERFQHCRDVHRELPCAEVRRVPTRAGSVSAARTRLISSTPG